MDVSYLIGQFYEVTIIRYAILYHLTHPLLTVLLYKLSTRPPRDRRARLQISAAAVGGA